MSNWGTFLRNKDIRNAFMLLALISLIFVKLFSLIMIWNESRPGYTFHDPIIAMIEPIDLSGWISLFTLTPIVFGIFLIARSPRLTTYLLFCIITICTLRALSLTLVPLEAPELIIPLTDPVIEHLFYGGQVLVKDLFFSGHTANLILIGLILETRKYKILLYLCGCIVGTLVVIQHVHYSIDVIAAPFFALAAYRISVWAAHYFILPKTTEKLKGIKHFRIL